MAGRRHPGRPREAPLDRSILIFSDPTDATTGQVMEWLEASGYPCIRIHEDDPLTGIDLDPGDESWGWLGFSSGRQVRLEQVHACWMRRGGPTLEPIPGPPRLAGSIRQEWAATLDLVVSRLEALPGLGTARPPSRLIQLQAAKRAGWEIPATRVSSRRAALEAFLAARPASITRAIEGPLVGEGGLVGAGTTAISSAELAPLSPHLTPALVQERIDKVWELRVYFLAGRCFAGAMPAGPVDIRQGVEPVRIVPYQLPRTVEAAIGRLMAALELGEGSLDLLVTGDDRFIFLEVNAHGQLHGLARACGYPIEQAIAQHLAEGRSRR